MTTNALVIRVRPALTPLLKLEKYNPTLIKKIFSLLDIQSLYRFSVSHKWSLPVKIDIKTAITNNIRAYKHACFPEIDALYLSSECADELLNYAILKAISKHLDRVARNPEPKYFSNRDSFFRRYANYVAFLNLGFSFAVLSILQSIKAPSALTVSTCFVSMYAFYWVSISLFYSHYNAPLFVYNRLGTFENIFSKACRFNGVDHLFRADIMPFLQDKFPRIHLLVNKPNARLSSIVDKMEDKINSYYTAHPQIPTLALDTTRGRVAIYPVTFEDVQPYQLSQCMTVSINVVLICILILTIIYVFSQNQPQWLNMLWEDQWLVNFSRAAMYSFTPLSCNTNILLPGWIKQSPKKVLDGLYALDYWMNFSALGMLFLFSLKDSRKNYLFLKKIKLPLLFNMQLQIANNLMFLFYIFVAYFMVRATVSYFIGVGEAYELAACANTITPNIIANATHCQPLSYEAFYNMMPKSCLDLVKVNVSPSTITSANHRLASHRFMNEAR